VSTTAIVDLHSHLIPGVDDGAPDLRAALAALRAMRAEGVVRAVTTPHFDAELTERPERMATRLARIDAGWQALSTAAAREVPQVTLERGMEVMLDIPHLRADDPRLRLAGGPALLVELPRLQLPPGTTAALSRLRQAGWLPILAHPERYVRPDALEMVEEWRRAGACTLVNAGSIIGSGRPDSARVARELFRQGLVDMVGSDFHARPERPLALRAAADRVVSEAGREVAALLFHTNPLRALRGEEMLEVRAFDPAPSLAGRLLRRLGAR
jgi:protein-tyrosine phosphatase